MNSGTVCCKVKLTHRATVSFLDSEEILRNAIRRLRGRDVSLSTSYSVVTVSVIRLYDNQRGAIFCVLRKVFVSVWQVEYADGLK